jgi:Rieske 2Fe-2S family protein
VRVDWLVRADAREGVDYQVDRLAWFWRTTGEQDWKLCEDNQAGVNSRRYQPGPYAPDEHRDGRGTEQFVLWYLDKLAS